MADAELDWEMPHGDLYVFRPARASWPPSRCPAPARYRIFGKVDTGPEGPAPEYSEPTHEQFQQMMDERCPVPTRVVREYWVSRYRLHRRTVPDYRAGRIFVVGDAAHVHSPAGAQGMNTGIQDAYNLAWKLAMVQRGNVTGANADTLLDSYSGDRHPVGERLLKATDRMFGVISGRSVAARLMRRYLGPTLAKTVLTRHSFRQWLAAPLAQLRITYPGSVLNSEDGSDWGDMPAPGDRAREAAVTID